MNKLVTCDHVEDFATLNVFGYSGHSGPSKNVEIQFQLPTMANNDHLEPNFVAVSDNFIADHVCDVCGKVYKRHCSLVRHKKYECNRPPTYPCSFCSYMAKYRTHLLTHMAHKHKGKLANF
ncbi:hypothetical protein QAD02_022637 [Eretmocerus hayati]|uniref:Uncharacterized protein n=1 Tax=Eretmocerus hayati TaxID=131215 RepID=A0ACC2PTN6_9HYME|nr:hypothetical protein QAD02_022637 [Eretmocerus hayati]